jgi:hypothetical protein
VARFFFFFFLRRVRAPVGERFELALAGVVDDSLVDGSELLAW